MTDSRRYEETTDLLTLARGLTITSRLCRQEPIGSGRDLVPLLLEPEMCRIESPMTTRDGNVHETPCRSLGIWGALQAGQLGPARKEKHSSACSAAYLPGRGITTVVS